MVVTFFGHRDIYEDIKSLLENRIVSLIEKDGAKVFYVGNNGDYDFTVYSVLKKLKSKYPFITCYVVLAYMPKDNDNFIDYRDTLFPEAVAASIPKFSIAKRNRWMLERSDVAVTYVKRSYGGAARYESIAVSRGKRVIELSEKQKTLDKHGNI